MNFDDILDQLTASAKSEASDAREFNAEINFHVKSGHVEGNVSGYPHGIALVFGMLATDLLKCGYDTGFLHGLVDVAARGQ